MKNRSSGVLISALRKYLFRSNYRYFSRQMAPFHSRNQAIPSDLLDLQKKDGTGKRTLGMYTIVSSSYHNLPQ